MTYNRHGNKQQQGKLIWLMVSVLIIATLAVVTFYSVQKKEGSVNQTGGQNIEKINNSEIVQRRVVYGEEIKSQDSLDQYIQSIENENSAFTIINKELSQVDNWEDNSLTPVQFYLPAGNSVSDISLDNNKTTITVLGAPKGCTYAAIQFRHIVFIRNSQQENIVDKDNADFIYTENPNECQQTNTTVKEIY